MQILTLHRELSRHAYFGVESRRAIFHDRGLNCWVASDPADAAAVLQSRSFDVVALHRAYEDFEGPSGERFPNLIFVLRYLPLGLNGDAHRDIRRRMAELIARRRPEISRAVPALVEKWFGLIETRDEVELVSEVVAPLVHEFICLLTETQVSEAAAAARVSMVFDRMIGLRTRRELDSEVATVRASIRASLGPDAPEVEEGLRLALFAVGNDALVGTIGEGLYRILNAHSGTALAMVPFPDLPGETGVPFVERIATEPVEIGGVGIAPGERVRVMLQGFAYSPDAADNERIFGAGVHSCLGRQMSVELWRAIVARLARMPVTVEVTGHALRKDNYVFTCPERLSVRIAR